MHSVSLLTPSHRRDIARFELLCESVDNYVTNYERHYVIVNDEDFQLFGRFASEKRVIMRGSRFLPRWLLPIRFSRNGRKVWLSLFSAPVHGWHIQQILKIAGALSFPEQRLCIVDSDNLFFRPFDPRAYAGGERAPLYVDRGSIAAEDPLHAVWTRNCDRLLGQPSTAFPADDFVGNLIVWDKSTVQHMTQAIETAMGTSWQLALCRVRPFSEYLLYGHFTTNSAADLAHHEIVEQTLASAHWDAAGMDRASIEAMISTAAPEQVALCIQSFSDTSVSDIRAALRAAA